MKTCIWNSICLDRDKWREELIQIKRSRQTLSQNLEVTGTSHSSCDTKFSKFAKPQVIKYE